MAKFQKSIHCDNCDESRTYRFEKGTDLRGRRIECANCGVLIPATRQRADTTPKPVEPWSFMRDFFGLKGGRS